MARIPHDYHMHSSFSGDNETPMEAMCRAAIAAGIPEIAFTEHFDVNPKEPSRGQFPLEAWRAELERCRRSFAGLLVIRAGLELSEPHTEPGLVADLVAGYDFDLLIGSLHWVGDELVFDRDYFRSRSPQAAYERYFVELERMTRLGAFDALGHLDIVARYGFEVYGSYEPRRYEDLIRPVLRNCIDRDIALDVNAGCLRRPLRKMTPDREILAWYAEMGGRRIIFSSDAHVPEDVGKGIGQAVETAIAAGFTKALRFERRIATDFSIE